MGDLATLAKARRELEELYLGVPDDSVNLTFGDLAQVQQQHATSSAEKKNNSTHAKMDPISAGNPKRGPSSLSPLTKIPSLDFSRGLEASANFYHHHHRSDEEPLHASQGDWRYGHGEIRNDRVINTVQGHRHDGHAVPYSPRRAVGLRHAEENSAAFDNASGTSMGSMNPFQERGGRRRPGIPHSNICTICSVYIYVFRNRCLVRSR